MSGALDLDFTADKAPCTEQQRGYAVLEPLLRCQQGLPEQTRGADQCLMETLEVKNLRRVAGQHVRQHGCHVRYLHARWRALSLGVEAVSAAVRIAEAFPAHVAAHDHRRAV